MQKRRSEGKISSTSAIASIRDIVFHFLTARKNNLVLYPAPDAMFLVSESDVKAVVNQAYEVLKEISHSAVANGDESTAIRVSEAFANIAIHTENLQSPGFRSNTAPLTVAPIYYLVSCAIHAQKKELDDVPFQSAAVLSRISLAAPKNVSLTDVHIPVLDGIFDFARQFYANRNAQLAEYVIGHSMAVLDKLLSGEEYHFRELLRHVLTKLEALAPFAVVNEAHQARLATASPLGKAYGLTNPQSLGYLFVKANQLIKVDPEREWINPYHEVVDILDDYWRHFRKIGEQVEFGDSFLLWEMTQLIKHIATSVGQLIAHQIRPDHNDGQELVDKLQWILSFFWVAFGKKKVVNQRRADDACDVLAYIGILFFEHGYPEVMKSSVSNIHSIIESYCQVAQPLDEHAIGDLFAHLWCLRVFTIAQDNSALTDEIDKALNTKPEPLSEDQWQNAQQAIELRRAQLMERLRERNGRLGRDTAEDLLRHALEETE